MLIGYFSAIKSQKLGYADLKKNIVSSGATVDVDSGTHPDCESDEVTAAAAVEAKPQVNSSAQADTPPTPTPAESLEKPLSRMSHGSSIEAVNTKPMNAVSILRRSTSVGKSFTR